MSAAGKGAIRLGVEEEVSERGWRGAGGDGGEQRALGRLSMTHSRPTSQPALEGREVRTACERRPLPSLSLSLAVLRHPAGAVEQGEIGLLLWQYGQEISERRNDCQAHAPAITVARTEQDYLPDGIRWCHAGRVAALHRLGDDKAEAVGEAVIERRRECAAGSA